MYISSIFNRKSNHLPHDLQYDILTTTLKTGVVNKEEQWYLKSIVILEGSTVHALAFLYFSASGSTNPDVF